jgi:hypothetical protein
MAGGFFENPLMHRLPAQLLSRWMRMGAYARLFVPITVLIVTIVCARYTLLVDSESAQARRQFALESQQATLALAEALHDPAEAGDLRRIGILLRQHAARNPAIATVLWQEGTAVREAWHLEEQPEYPAWFPRFAAIEPLYYDVPIGAGQVSITFRPSPALNGTS